MTACLLLSHEIIFPYEFFLPPSVPARPSASVRSILCLLLLLFFHLFFPASPLPRPPFFLVSENPESQCREECSRLAAIATTANADFREHNASSTHCACSAAPAVQPPFFPLPSFPPSRRPVPSRSAHPLRLRGIVLFVKSICIAPRFSQRH